MKHSFGIGFPELVGFFILGGTAGALVSSLAYRLIGVPPLLGGIVCAVLLPLGIAIPWRRLVRRRKLVGRAHATTS